MADSTLVRLGSIAERRWGLVTTAQAEDAGVSRKQLARMASAGAIERVAQGVYRMAGAPPQDHEATYATWLALGGATAPFPIEIANRDAAVFTDPDELDVRRNAHGQHMAFGFGVHQCLGQPLARLELQIVYGTLYRRIPTLALAVDPLTIPFKHDGIVYGVRELPVTW
jgi:Transcriptional regulator, AbiEi antitoxin/Cytochrome P450